MDGLVVEVLVPRPLVVVGGQWMAWWLQEMVEDWMFSEGRKRERERKEERKIIIKYI
jgi:hypothetical protein